MDTNKEKTGISIVIAVHDNADELERHLPLFLSQDYEGEVQVVIVDESSTDGTSDVLKRFCHQHDNIYVTFVPPTSRYVSRRKLALTIGVKAAKHEWVVFCDINCYPSDNHWLESFVSTIADDSELVMGLTMYEPKTPIAMRFVYAEDSARVMAWGAKGKAVRYNGKALAIRKSLFLSTNGFLQNLKFIRGEYDYLVNEHATEHSVAVHVDTDHFMTCQTPSLHTWINEQLFYKDTCKHLQRKWKWTVIYKLLAFATALAYFIPLNIAVYGFFMSQWMWTGIGAAALVLIYGVHSWWKGRKLRRVGLAIPYPLVPLLSFRSLMHRAWISLRYALSDKGEYIRR